MSEHGHDHHHEHGHDHGEDGHHHPLPASEAELRTRALEALLVEKGLVSTDAIDAVIDLYVNDVGPQNGARVVARAWTDPDVPRAAAARRLVGHRTRWATAARRATRWWSPRTRPACTT